jgi:sec-independent protein translocase protein TatB
MFDFAWSEIALIAAVALIAIGPKDMPAAIRGITDVIKKARRMAAEFQTHVDEMVREANLDEVRSSFNDIRNFDVRGEIERAVDADGTLRSTFESNPLEPTVPVASPPDEMAFAEPEVAEPEPVPEVALAPPPAPVAPLAPAFIPPNMLPPPAPCSGKHGTAQTEAEPEPPAFIPPEVVLQRRSRPPA